jgi:transposase
VGLVTSSTIRAWTADIDRFNSYKEYASYCGLVPYLKESNDVTYLGHITKRGPKELRAAMVQVVMGMLRVREKNPDWIFYQRYGYWKSKKSSGKAIIACARKMSRVIYCMLKNKEGFNPEKMKPEKKNSRERLLKVS